MKKRKTILLIHYNAHSTGSARTRILTLTAHLAERYDIIFWLPAPGSLAAPLQDLGVRVEFRELHDNTAGFIHYGMKCLSFSIYCLVRQIRLVHLLDHHWWKPAELISLQILQIPFISMVAFDRPDDARAGGIRWAAKIVANSHSTARDFIDAGLIESTTVIHNAINPEPYLTAASIREELFPDAGGLVGFVGVLHPIKGIDTLLRAFALVVQQIADARLVIVGPEKESGERQRLLELVETLSLGEVTRFFDYRDDIPQVMASLDCLVVPSKAEPFGFVTIEAGAAGAPVVGSAVGGILEVIRDGVDGYLLEPNDTDGFATRIAELLSDPVLRRRLGSQFRQRVLKDFSYDRVLKQWDEIYQELLP